SQKREPMMATKNGKTRRKIDLLQMSDVERVKFMEKIKLSLRQSISEAKLLKALLQYESITINGHVVFSEDGPLNGLVIQKGDL
ncbi:MAG: hypothetical protein QXH20_06680, partial [Candidatus Bathyarchaeia archaeon]